MQREKLEVEAAIRKKWIGIAQGAKLHEGIPKSDLFSTNRALLTKANAVVDKLVRKIAIMKTNGQWATGMHTYVYKDNQQLSCIITAGHVIPDHAHSMKTQVSLNFQKNMRKWTQLDPGKLYWKSSKADVAICACRKNIPNVPEIRVLCQSAKELQVGEAVRILQHPNASPMVYDVGKVVLPSTSRQFFLHDVNTLPGSSGAPILDVEWNVVGVHVGATEMAGAGGKKTTVNEGCYTWDVAAAVLRKGFTLCP